MKMLIAVELERIEDLQRELKKCKNELKYARSEDDLKSKESWIVYLESKLRKQVNEMITKRERLLDAMSKDPDKTFSIEELRVYFNFNSHDMVYHYIYKALKSGEVERVSRGKYRINSEGLATLERLKKLKLIMPEK